MRLALGARSGDILRLVMWRGVKLVSIGSVIGLFGAWLLTRLLKGLLIGVNADDPPTFVGITLLLSLVALLAIYLPARRATRIDPQAALRSE